MGLACGGPLRTFFFPERFISAWVIHYGKVSLQLTSISVLPKYLRPVTVVAVWGKEVQSELYCNKLNLHLIQKFL